MLVFRKILRKYKLDDPLGVTFDIIHVKISPLKESSPAQCYVVEEFLKD